SIRGNSIRAVTTAVPPPRPTSDRRRIIAAHLEGSGEGAACSWGRTSTSARTPGRRGRPPPQRTAPPSPPSPPLPGRGEKDASGSQPSFRMTTVSVSCWLRDRKKEDPAGSQETEL